MCVFSTRVTLVGTNACTFHVPYESCGCIESVGLNQMGVQLMPSGVMSHGSESVTLLEREGNGPYLRPKTLLA